MKALNVVRQGVSQVFSFSKKESIPETEQQKVDRYIDELLKTCPPHAINVRNELRKLGLEPAMEDKVKPRMIALNYVSKHGNYPVLLTSHGQIVKDSGGHLNYLEKNRKQEELDKAVKVSNIKMAQFTKWTVIVTCLGIITSLVIAFFQSKPEERKETPQSVNRTISNQ